MLFKDIVAIRKFISVAKDSSLEDFRSIMENDTEQSIILPIIGDALLTELQVAVTADDGASLNATKTKLLACVRYVVAQHAMLQFVPLGRVTFSKVGITVTLTDTERSASAEQIYDVKKQLEMNISGGIERLYSFLESNKGALDTWVSSAAFTLQRCNFINSAIEFNRYFAINSSRQFFQRLRAILTNIEDSKIKSALGNDLFDEIKLQIKVGNISNNNSKILDYIKILVANAAIVDAVIQFDIDFTTSGLQLSFVTEEHGKKQQKTPADQIRLANLSKSCGMLAESKLKDLIDYLYANADTYPLYKASSSYIAPVNPISINESGSGIAMF